MYSSVHYTLPLPPRRGDEACQHVHQTCTHDDSGSRQGGELQQAETSIPSLPALETEIKLLRAAGESFACVHTALFVPLFFGSDHWAE